MVKEFKNNGQEVEPEQKDLLEIFMDEGSGQLEDKLLKSKKKLLNAKVE
jgi:hypothetical protein